MNDPKIVNDLYVNKDTLSTRINIHDKYSVNKYGWSNWVFDKYNLSENAKVIEFGCGTGNIWNGKIKQIPDNINIVLTDISPLMIEKTKEKLISCGNFSFQTADIQDIPFPENCFDMVIANSMLYHVPDIQKALSEVKRVLKNDGVFYAATVGVNHLKELQDIYKRYEDKVYLSYSAKLSFTLENGTEILSRHFNVIEKEQYADSLEVTDANDLMDYIVSYNKIPDDIYQSIHGIINAQINEKGMFRVYKDSGIFICKK